MNRGFLLTVPDLPDRASIGNHGTDNQGLFNTGNHNLGIALTGDNLIGIGPLYVLR